MVLYRITSKIYTKDLSGTGASLFGGRWNPKGVRMLYTTENLSLTALEIIANLSGAKLNNELFCVELSFPDHLPVDEIRSLPKDWSAFPYHAETVRLGKEFINEGGLCLKVPSAIIPSEFNFLLNPNHDRFSEVKLLDTRPLILDQRLLK